MSEFTLKTTDGGEIETPIETPTNPFRCRIYGEPYAEVEFIIDPGEMADVTLNSEGYAEIEIPAGTIGLTAQATGHQALVIV